MNLIKKYIISDSIIIGYTIHNHNNQKSDHWNIISSSCFDYPFQILSHDIQQIPINLSHEIHPDLKPETIELVIITRNAKISTKRNIEKFEKSSTIRENWFAKSIPRSFRSRGTVQRKEGGVSIPLETTAATWRKRLARGKRIRRGRELGHSSRQFSPQGRSKIRRGGENPSPFDALSAMRIRHDHGSALDATTRFRSHVYHANY